MPSWCSCPRARTFSSHWSFRLRNQYPWVVSLYSGKSKYLSCNSTLEINLASPLNRVSLKWGEDEISFQSQASFFSQGGTGCLSPLVFINCSLEIRDRHIGIQLSQRIVGALCPSQSLCPPPYEILLLFSFAFKMLINVLSLLTESFVIKR